MKEMDEMIKSMKLKLYKILTVMMVSLVMPSFIVYASTLPGPDDPDKKSKDMSVETPPTMSGTSYGMPSPRPEKALNDHSSSTANVSKPILIASDPSYSREASMASSPSIEATAIAMTSKSMPSSFRGCARNEIIGSENLNGIFSTLAKGEKTVRILQIGDSHVRGNTFPQTIEKSLESNFNVRFDFIGINGARASKFTSSDMLSKINSKHPDLVIISFGTNEAHGNFSSSSNTRVMNDLVSGIRKHNPQVTFLITTTPGSHISRSGKKVVNTTHEQVAQNLLEFGRNNGIAVWDLYHNIGGNENACKNLIGAGLMQGDKIHLTHSGYRMIGNMLSEAFINAYNQFLVR